MVVTPSFHPWPRIEANSGTQAFALPLAPCICRFNISISIIAAADCVCRASDGGCIGAFRTTR
jgi:hypothetical protein